MRQINSEVLSPIVRYKDLVSALQGLADMSALSTSAPDSKSMKGLQEVVESDEQRLAELETLFGWIDQDGDGKLRLGELEQAAKALGGASEKLVAQIKEQVGASPLSVDLPTFVRLMTAKVRAFRCAAEKDSTTGAFNPWFCTGVLRPTSILSLTFPRLPTWCLRQ